MISGYESDDYCISPQIRTERFETDINVEVELVNAMRPQSSL